MKKYIAGGVIVVALVLYLILSNRSSAPTTAAQQLTQIATTTNIATSTGGTTAGQYKDGTYTGPVEDAVYGNLQVSIAIQNGWIVDVAFPQYPNAPGHTTDVSNSALPALKQEAIQAQSANVDIISGATQDSQAFQQSLAGALAQAN